MSALVEFFLRGSVFSLELPQALNIAMIMDEIDRELLKLPTKKIGALARLGLLIAECQLCAPT